MGTQGFRIESRLLQTPSVLIDQSYTETKKPNVQKHLPFKVTMPW